MDDIDAPPLDSSLAPLLLFDCGRGGADDDEEAIHDDSELLIYSIPKGRLLVPRAPELDYIIDNANWITPQGWVLTLDPATRDASLRDPFTSRRVRLPQDRDNLLASSKATRCVLSTPQLPMDDGSCVVLVIHRTDPVLCYCRPGGSRWIRHEYRPESLVVDDRFGREKIIKAMAKLTAAGDAFYTFWDDKLATLQLSPEPRLSASHVEDEPQRTNCYLVTRSRLVESCGEMFRVQFSYTKLCDRRIQRVEVHKLDRSTSTWVKKVTDLGNRVFFVSSGQFGASIDGSRRAWFEAKLHIFL
ncbi:hypothetical protein ACP70R_006773 [Stipagrostis hirtigluma subsp. patula]